MNIISRLVLLSTAVCMTIGTAMAAPPFLQPLKIIQVYADVDVAPGTLTIIGSNFDNGAAPTITLGGWPVTVTGYDSGSISGEIPATVGAGDYLLTVSTGTAVTQNGSLSLTIGDGGSQAKSITRLPHYDPSTGTWEDTSLPSTIPGATLVTMDLGPGAYYIHALAYVQGASANEFAAQCRLAAANGVDQFLVLAKDDATGGQLPLVGTALHSFSEPGAVTFTCNDSLAQPARWASVRLTAIRVQSIDTTIIN